MNAIAAEKPKLCLVSGDTIRAGRVLNFCPYCGARIFEAATVWPGGPVEAGAIVVGCPGCGLLVNRGLNRLRFV